MLRDSLRTNFSCWLRQNSWRSCEGFSSEVMVPCCRDVRRHALHDVNFRHWAYGRDNFALCFAHFGKPYDALPGLLRYAKSVLSRTRFTVMFQ